MEILRVDGNKSQRRVSFQLKEFASSCLIIEGQARVDPLRLRILADRFNGQRRIVDVMEEK